tara:strand:+ start:38652 stop:38810 length:159 start_codon:yes stop_codon:yes gene_type:complete
MKNGKKVVKQRNFVVKQMQESNMGSTSFHKDKRKETQKIRGKKHKLNTRDYL